MAAQAPPPYRRDTPPSETTLPATLEPSSSTLQLNTGDISGLRAQILDNAQAVFVLHYTSWRPLPENMCIVTSRAKTSSSTQIAGKVHAAVLSRAKPGMRSTGSGELGLFVQGPQADTTEDALRGLLSKLETMIGARWERHEFDRKNYVDK